jgi:hypothetical protein
MANNRSRNKVHSPFVELFYSMCLCRSEEHCNFILPFEQGSQMPRFVTDGVRRDATALHLRHRVSFQVVYVAPWRFVGAFVRFMVLTAASMKFWVFWDVQLAFQCPVVDRIIHSNVHHRQCTQLFYIVFYYPSTSFEPIGSPSGSTPLKVILLYNTRPCNFVASWATISFSRGALFGGGGSSVTHVHILTWDI